MRAALVVPVKDFRQAKVRLSAALSPDERASLARAMAAHVVAVGAPLPAWVVCDDEVVAEWAGSVGASVIWTPGRGLNGAVTDAVAHLAAEGVDRVVVAHGDLPLARDLAWAARFPGATIVPDRHDEGTNVICIPARSGFRFMYGPGSFRRHAAEGRRLDLPVRVVREPGLGWDVDMPADLLHPALPSARP